MQHEGCVPGVEWLRGPPSHPCASGIHERKKKRLFSKSLAAFHRNRSEMPSCSKHAKIRGLSFEMCERVKVGTEQTNRFESEASVSCFIFMFSGGDNSQASH